MADMFTPQVARNPYATPAWAEAPGRFKRDFNVANDPTGLRAAAGAFSGALTNAFAKPVQDFDALYTGQQTPMDRMIDVDPYSGGIGFTGGTGKLPKIFDNYAADPTAWLKQNAPSALGAYQDYINKYNQWKSQYTAPSLDASIRQAVGGYAGLTGLGGLDSATNRVNSNLARYGISDLSQIGSRTGATGKPEYYKLGTGELLPDQFGHFKSGSQGTLRMKLATNPDGSVSLKPDFTSPKKQADDYGEDLTKAFILAVAGAGLGQALGGGGDLAASGAETGAAGAGNYAPVAEATVTPVSGSYSYGTLGSGISDAGATYGASTLGSGSTGASTIGTGLGELGSGTSWMGSMGPIEGLGTVGGTGGTLATLKNLYDAYSTGSKVYNATTGGGGQQQQGGGGTGMANANILPLLSALYAQGNTTPDKLQEIARAALERGDPFGPQRAQYATQLAETYTDPQKVFDEQYGALDKTFFNELMAQDAARGRATDAYKRGVEREAKFQDWMNNYRGQLGGFAGANIDPSRMAGQYMASMGDAAYLNNYLQGEPVRALGSLFGGPDGSGGMSLNDLISGGKKLYDYGSDLWDWGVDYFGSGA